MRFFKLIKSNVDVQPLLAEVYANEDAWLINTARQTTIKVQQNTNNIHLRKAVRRPDFLNSQDNQETITTPEAARFPKIMAFMEDLARERSGSLSRATIVRLKPQSAVYRHIDNGTYYFIRDRFHLVLYSTAGSVLISGDEEVRMQTGDLWWFDNKQHHEAHNSSQEWRIHLIFDILPDKYKHMAVNAIELPECMQKEKQSVATPHD